jgi:hypothetical protein
MAELTTRRSTMPISLSASPADYSGTRRSSKAPPRPNAVAGSERDKLGRPISAADAQVAAICRVRGAILATRNIKDFEETGVELGTNEHHRVEVRVQGDQSVEQHRSCDDVLVRDRSLGHSATRSTSGLLPP